MAAHGMFAATDLEPQFVDRGIKLSSVQVWRLVTQTPERLSLRVLSALCDIFECTPAELIATRAENAAPRKTSTADAEVVDLATSVRPKRARIRPE
ncbi:Cro/C1-type helix-turn-helix DNA-binding protein [Saccharopolyspora spinosa]|uniref:Cro/C1-type helix-turn-helix DNA-binding protein n=2 Tax=Saccharopolyspora spinosa TaxID=60894 RepID=A0A2N3Y1C4_SACSN|nr:Cro/C1-type helix-turn-helix DNA-binding protein [Saccharopolyspora spinosa]